MTNKISAIESCRPCGTRQFAGGNPSDESLGYVLSPWRAGALAFALFMLLSSSLFAQTNDGSGPEISIPKNLPPDLAHALPPPNWIDQSQLLQKEF